MRIVQAQSTPLFVSTERGPCQVVRVTVAGEPPGGPAPAPVHVRVEGPGVTTPRPARIGELSPGAERAVEVPVAVAAPHGPGSKLSVTAIAEGPGTQAERAVEITAAEPGWTIWMVCHFHYDPVWWNSQGGFTEAGLAMPGEDGRLPDVRTAFELVRLHLDAARDDPDYKFVLAEVDYLKPYFDAHPQDRAELRDLIAAGRAELVGGAYNEPNTNLTSAESTIRNIIYGLGHQRDVLGADPSVAWALDAFGHDPGYPGLMAAAGMTGSAWARGPFHQWGPWRTVGDNSRMQFPSEFEWISPDGQGLLTSYMANHYGAGWVIHQAVDLEAAKQEALGQLALLAPVAATRNVLLPVGADHVIPPRWATAVHRDFAARYVWPRCVTGLPREFFAAVRAEAAERGIWLTPQTRDMNPVYPGKDVSYIDTKQAQRAAEVAVSDGERLATLAWLAGAGYPAESLDKAWRQLVFGAHHDAITGTESDQVYLDLLSGWREAFDRGGQVREEAAGFLAGLVNTLLVPPPRSAPAPALLAPAPPPRSRQQYTTTAASVVPLGRAVVVFNTLSWPRAGLAARTLEFAAPGPAWLVLTDETGASVPFLAEGIRRHADDSLASVRITFLAEVPALGYRSYQVNATPETAAASDPGPGADVAAGWAPLQGTVIANETFEVAADPARGGGLSRVLDQRTGTELLGGPGNELVLTEEYPAHPRWGEGPWLLCPQGPGSGSAGVPASVSAQRCPIGSRLVARFSLGDLRITQETILWDGLDRVEFRTHVDGSIGQDRLLRVRFPASVPGGLPVFQCATAVVGRPFGVADSDVAEDAYTLDNPACEWFGLSSAVRVSAGGHTWAAGVAEVIVPDGLGVGAPAPVDASSGDPGAGDVTGRAEGAGGAASAGASDARASRGGDVAVDAGGAGVSDTGAGGGDAAGRRAGVRGLVAALAAAGVTATCSRAGGPRYGALDLDSNLPDFRIAIGGPDVNPWTARLLAGLGPVGTGAAARLAAPGGARVWVPAARPRAEVFTASADVRGDRDLPVLIVSGPDLPAAVAELTTDMGDAVIGADLAEGAPGDAGLHDRLLDTHSVALLNQGTPSSLVTPDGSLYIALMRASSAWPAGVWLDGPRRTPGDGSSFAWQHWSHEFRYALAAGTGDWRDAGFVVAGQEYNHDLLAVETGIHDGPLPLSASLAEVSTPGRARPGATLSALKPRGNPLASGQPGRPRREGGVTIRLRDADGLPAGPGRAQVSLLGGITAAQVTDLTEHGDGAEVGVAAGRALIAVPPAGLVTVAAQPGPGGLAEPGTAGGTGLELIQPVFTRYWLHGKGPAPAGNLPVAVHLSPGHITLAGPTAARQPEARPLYLSVACGTGSATGEVTLDVPPGLAVTGPDGDAAGPLRYALDAGCPHREWELSVAALPGARPGRYFVAARIPGGPGEELEDAVLVTVGEPPPPSRVMPRAERDALLVADLQAREAEVEVAVEPAVLEVAPGQRAALAVRLDNRTASVIRGESQLMSPFGTWHQVGAWTRGFTAGPGDTITVDYTVAVPAWARPGSHWWALAKVMYFGRVRYTECAQIRVTGGQ